MSFWTYIDTVDRNRLPPSAPAVSGYWLIFLSLLLSLSLFLSLPTQRERMNPHWLTHTFTYTLAHPNHSLQAYVHLLACQFIPALNKTTIQVHKNLFHSFVTSFAISWTTLSSFTPLSDHCHQIIKKIFPYLLNADVLNFGFLLQIYYFLI